MIFQYIHFALIVYTYGHEIDIHVIIDAGKEVSNRAFFKKHDKGFFLS